MQLLRSTSAAERSLPDKTPARRAARASKKLFLPGEIPAEFFILLKQAFHHYRPPFLSHASNLTDVVRAHWMLIRHSRNLDDYRTKLFRRKPDSVFWSESEIEQLEILQGLERRATRAHNRALQKIENMPSEAPGGDEYRQLHRLYRDLLDLEAFPYEFGHGFPFDLDDY